MKQLTDFLDISPEVQKALQAQKPIVALESTIISHGMPYPQNLETAIELENLIRAEGAIPATMAIMGGKIKIGLRKEDLELLASADNVFKASRRDMSWLISTGKTAATTVAATMICASLVNIPIFATGGVGGVHRGATETMDISADLQELAHTQLAVVSAGVKSILDIPLTLEYLETMGVPVVCVNTDTFPAFYTRESGIQSPLRLDHPKEIADMMDTQWKLGLKNGMLIANPIPEAFSMDPVHIQSVIDQALEEAKNGNISGKNLTPFLLSRIKELTAGSSLFSNIKLVQHNALIAARIAVHYHDMQK